MKFFTDFVSCFGSIRAPPSTTEITVSSPSPESESRLGQSGSRSAVRNIRRKRGRSSDSVAGSGYWKLSLGAISEHNVAAVRKSVADQRMRTVVDQQGQRKVKRNSFTGVNESSSSANKIHHCVHHRQRGLRAWIHFSGASCNVCPDGDAIHVLNSARCFHV